MAIDTSARRSSRNATLTDTIEDVVIDIEDALAKMTLTEREQLIGMIKLFTANVVIDPSSIASGKTPLALGAGPAPKPADPKLVMEEALSAYATENGLDPNKIKILFAITDTPEKLANATSGAEGRMVPKSELTNEQAKVTMLVDRLKDTEDHLGLSAGTLDPTSKKDWKKAIDAVRPVTGTPAAGIDPGRVAKIRPVLEKLKASAPGFGGKRKVDNIDPAEIDAALDALK